MSVFRACRLPLFVAASIVALSGCIDGNRSVAMAQARPDLDALVYGAPNAAPAQPQQPMTQPQPQIAQRGLFTSSSSGSSSSGALGALASLGSRMAAPRQPYVQIQQPQSQDYQQSYAQMQPRNDLDAQAYGRPAEAAPPLAPVQQRGLFNGPSRVASSGGALAALGAGFRAPRRAYAAPAAYYPPPPVIAYDPEYRLDAGDRLRVVVYGQEGLTNTYTIGAAGTITMPLIGGVPARGSTPAALAAHITGRLRDGFIREPSVAVEIEAYRPFFILGEVAAPGQYPYVPHMSVESAVAIAGGFSPRAKRDIVTLTHATPEGLLRAVVPVGTPLSPGDTILVGERWF